MVEKGTSRPNEASQQYRIIHANVERLRAESGQALEIKQELEGTVRLAQAFEVSPITVSFQIRDLQERMMSLKYGWFLQFLPDRVLEEFSK
jgi:hypothetical protein